MQKAIAFARKSHDGQLRKTGEPYLTHCIHTGKILAALIPSAGKRVLLSPLLVHYSGILHNLVTLLLWHTLNSLENIKSHSWPHIHSSLFFLLFRNGIWPSIYIASMCVKFSLFIYFLMYLSTLCSSFSTNPAFFFSLLFLCLAGCWYSCCRHPSWCRWRYWWDFGKHRERVWCWRSKIGSWSIQTKLHKSGTTYMWE